VIVTGRIADVLKVCEAERSGGRSVGFVPTMGALHEGHRSLIRRARAERDFVVVSIFVNPAQFGPHEDLDAYPRPLEADLEVCEAEGADLVFNPQPDELYPHGSRTTVHVSTLTETMEGEHRPDHFDGVTLVCAKLFNVVGPCTAYFGEKDAQQLRVVRRMASDLDLRVEIASCPTVRDEDGLALSSRNVYLDPAERRRALALPKALDTVRRLVERGVRDADVLVRAGKQDLREADSVDYLEVVNPETLERVQRVDGPVLVCGAVRIGRTRLIDNALIEIEETA
jgi:pantoate--beta-alanine ligase